MAKQLTKQEQGIMEATPIHPHEPSPRPKPGESVSKSIPSLMDRILEQKKALLNMQENLHLQQNGVANQLFLIEQLLNPDSTPPTQGEPSTTPKEPSNTM